MNSMKKMALITASVLSVSALSACQSANTVPDSDHKPMMKQHHGQHDRKMTPEQHEQFQQSRAERRQMMQQFQKACDGKAVGAAVQIKTSEKTIDGTCSMGFKADRQEMKRMHKEMMGMHGEMESMHMQGDHQPMRGEMKGMHMKGMPMQSAEPLTDAKRTELTRQFDQRLAQHQAHQQAMLKACQGQPNGKAVQVKMGTHTINGKCEVRFQPKAPMAPATAKPAS